MRLIVTMIGGIDRASVCASILATRSTPLGVVVVTKMKNVTGASIVLVSEIGMVRRPCTRSSVGEEEVKALGALLERRTNREKRLVVLVARGLATRRRRESWLLDRRRTS